MKEQYETVAVLALAKGYKPRWGKSMALRKTFNEEDLLVRLVSIQKWLRDKKNIDIDIITCKFEDEKVYNCIVDNIEVGTETENDFEFVDYTSYETALLASVETGLNLIK